MEKINLLKRKFKGYNLDGYLIPKNDEFFSEYTPNNKNNLQYISNFSGSCSVGLILKKNNFLFVDGRYTVQANIQSGNFFKILTLPFDKKKLKFKLKNKKIGFDPRLFNENTINLFSNKLGIKCVAIKENLINSIKKDKINVPKKKNFTFLKNPLLEKIV